MAESRSHVLELPTEIRNMIYGYAVGTPAKPIYLDNAITPALARTSSCLRKEVLPSFLRVNTFHIVALHRASSVDSSAFAFNIGTETYTWLRNLGPKIPLFTSLHIHFGSSNNNTLAITCNRAGVRLSHGASCQFCHPKPVVPILPPSLYEEVNVDANLLHQIMAINRTRWNAMRDEHDSNLDNMRALLVGAGAVDEHAIALTLDDMKIVERGLSTGNATYALAVQGINQTRVDETPLFVRTPEKVWSLIAEE